MYRLLIIGSTLLYGYTTAHANEFETAIQHLCQKTQHCVMTGDKQVKVDKGMQSMMNQMFANICSGIKNTYQQSITVPRLVKPATLCIDSRSALPCAKMGKNTPECDNYKRIKQHYKQS